MSVAMHENMEEGANVKGHAGGRQFNRTCKKVTKEKNVQKDGYTVQI